jgi:hypothetical protein
MNRASESAGQEPDLLIAVRWSVFTRKAPTLSCLDELLGIAGEAFWKPAAFDRPRYELNSHLLDRFEGCGINDRYRLLRKREPADLPDVIRRFCCQQGFKHVISSGIIQNNEPSVEVAFEQFQLLHAHSPSPVQFKATETLVCLFWGQSGSSNLLFSVLVCGYLLSCEKIRDRQPLGLRLKLLILASTEPSGIQSLREMTEVPIQLLREREHPFGRDRPGTSFTHTEMLSNSGQKVNQERAITCVLDN